MKKQRGLGNKLIILDCADKKDDEVWSKGINLANFPCPFRQHFGIITKLW